MDDQIGGVKAQNGAMEGMYSIGHRFVSLFFDDKQIPDPDPYQGENSEPDPNQHQS
jgi:hypothetical protein